ncbi:hypothetical protein [Variovorax sp. PBL-E5]|uniref:hypothetical protein n=1 Tax=Variovorax sp. PBL-E5 TaxID=434014 RepID=UPI001E5C79B1|nr:hypothetical protein [Variovorax sp. PBL-E5]
MQILVRNSQSMAAVDHTNKEQAVSSKKRYQLEWYTGAMFFVTFIGAHLIFGAKTAVKVAGVACVATGILWMFRRTVPVGVEGRAPSFYLGGWAAVVVGVAIAIVGVCLLAYSGLAACLLGWAPAGEC